MAGWRFSVIFNSAGQRRHSAYTRFLISQMDEIIATSEISASFLDVLQVSITASIWKVTSRRKTARPPSLRRGCLGKWHRRLWPGAQEKGIDLFVALDA